MKVRVGIERKEYHCGEIELTSEQYEKYMGMSDMDLIACMLLKESIKKTEDEWILPIFEEIK